MSVIEMERGSQMPRTLNAAPPARVGASAASQAQAAQVPVQASPSPAGAGLLARLRPWAVLLALVAAVALGYAFMRRRRLQQLRLQQGEQHGDGGASCEEGSSLRDAMAVVQQHGGGMFDAAPSHAGTATAGGGADSPLAEEDDPLFTYL